MNRRPLQNYTLFSKCTNNLYIVRKGNRYMWQPFKFRTRLMARNYATNFMFRDWGLK